jgi:hypothetical protein
VASRTLAPWSRCSIIGIPIAQLYDDQDETAKKVADLTDEAIELARTWQALPEEQRVAMKAAVESLVKS